MSPDEAKRYVVNNPGSEIRDGILWTNNQIGICIGCECSDGECMRWG